MVLASAWFDGGQLAWKIRMEVSRSQHMLKKQSGEVALD